MNYLNIPVTIICQVGDHCCHRYQETSIHNYVVHGGFDPISSYDVNIKGIIRKFTYDGEAAVVEIPNTNGRDPESGVHGDNVDNLWLIYRTEDLKYAEGNLKQEFNRIRLKDLKI